jgi:hypothetical protein
VSAATIFSLFFSPPEAMFFSFSPHPLPFWRFAFLAPEPLPPFSPIPRPAFSSFLLRDK